MVPKPFRLFVEPPAISLFAKRWTAMACVIVGVITAACTQATEHAAPPVTVFAAASLTDALGEIAHSYEQASGQSVRLSFAASGSIAHQIEAGAPADVVFLADELWMDRLQAASALDPTTRTDLLRNSLVLIAHEDAATGADPFAWLTATNGRLAIGDPESVPAGTYARAWLQGTGRWDELQPRIIMAADVRAVRTFVQRGEAGLGLVYRSDIVGAPDVKVVAEPPLNEQPDILYPVAATRMRAENAGRFLEFLQGPEARRIFIARGFEPAR